jgi:hypothetical protein
MIDLCFTEYEYIVTDVDNSVNASNGLADSILENF